MRPDDFLTYSITQFNRLSFECGVAIISTPYRSLKISPPNFEKKASIYIYTDVCMYVCIYLHTESREFLPCHCGKSKPTMNLKFYMWSHYALEKLQSKFQLNRTILSYLLRPLKNAIFPDSYIFYIVALASGTAATGPLAACGRERSPAAAEPRSHLPVHDNFPVTHF